MWGQGYDTLPQPPPQIGSNSPSFGSSHLLARAAGVIVLQNMLVKDVLQSAQVHEEGF